MVYSKVIQKELNVKRNCKVIFFKRKDARIFTNIKNRICSTFSYVNINNLSEHYMIDWLISRIPASILTIIYILLLFIVGLFLSHLLGV